MSNKHVKTINGKKYYYESVRKGRKVTSRYIGPAEETKEQISESVVADKKPIKEEDLITPDDHYIG
ncbi:MAG: hypothetical protein HY364_02970 [Candidatus Aenigmarchaeota archaeon]|nr:hypothetical protein [Candidatus Aenigmarchaeota archaeon]